MADILLGFVGDLLVDRDRPDEAFEAVRAALAAPDILSGNLEAVYTDAPHLAPSCIAPLCPAPHNLDVFARAGFDVMSLANNHICDLGHAAMLDNIARLSAQGVASCGAGRDIAAARAPAVLGAGGLRVACLSVASVFPHGYEARADMPGLAPLRAYNHYREAYPNYHAPGAAPRLRTIPDAADLERLLADIAAAREAADLVVVSVHWGDTMDPHHLTDHELRTGRLLAENGADIVIGHHHHILRGVEWHAGSPIFYGLGHFLFDVRNALPPETQALMQGDPEDPGFYGIAPRRGWPLLPMHADARMTALAWVSVAGGRVAGAGFLPCRIRPDGTVHPVTPDSAEGREVLDHVARGCASQGLNGRVEGGGGIPLGGHPTARILPASDAAGQTTSASMAMPSDR